MKFNDENDNFNESIGDRLILLRMTHSLTQSYVAKHLKMTKREYELIEAGRSIPDYFTVRRFMVIYGCTSDYLLFGIMLGLRQELFRRLTRSGMVSANYDKEDKVVEIYK